jgi:hypothetical protein
MENRILRGWFREGNVSYMTFYKIVYAYMYLRINFLSFNRGKIMSL